MGVRTALLSDRNGNIMFQQRFTVGDKSAVTAEKMGRKTKKTGAYV